MSFHATNDRIYITNQNDEVVFDTNNKMPAITQTITGSRVLSAGTHLLGSVDPSSNFIYPVLRYTAGNWAGTCEIGLCSRLVRAAYLQIPQMNANGTITWIYTTEFSCFTFLLSNGKVYLECVVNGGGFDSHALQYKILVGKTI